MKLDKTIIEACLSAIESNVEVRITFSNFLEAYTATKQIAGCFDQLGLLDMGKTMRSTSSIELTNGSGIVIVIEMAKSTQVEELKNAQHVEVIQIADDMIMER